MSGIRICNMCESAALRYFIDYFDERPGFLDILFEKDDKKYLQVIASDGILSRFEEVNVEESICLAPTDRSERAKIGDQAWYGFRNKDGGVVIEQWEAMRTYLYQQCDDYIAMPFVGYEIAEFLQDEDKKATCVHLMMRKRDSFDVSSSISWDYPTISQWSREAVADTREHQNTRDEVTRAIAIPVSQPERICFVITPFSDEFALLYTLVADAATRVGLRPIRTDYVIQNQDIMRQVHDNIRSATVVVAVCSPVANGQPNVNVMYEIGYARALGKSTLFVTTTTDLPFNLRGRQVVEYTMDQLSDTKGRTSLVNEITDKMYTLMAAMVNPLTDPSEKDIFVIPAVYASPDMWVKIQTIVLFAKTIHHEMQTLQHICLDALQAKATQVRENVPRTHLPFRNALTQFDLYWFSSQAPQNLTRVINDERQVESALLYLKEHLKGHEEKYRLLCRSHDSHMRMTPLLQEYSTVRDRLDNPSAPVAYLVQTVIELYTKTKFLLTHADNLLKDMAVVMAER